LANYHILVETQWRMPSARPPELVTSDVVIHLMTFILRLLTRFARAGASGGPIALHCRTAFRGIPAQPGARSA